MKPVDWPRYMVAKKLARGRVAYFWSPRKADREAGCALDPTPLGSDYGAARARAEELNTALDEWRAGKGGLAVMARVDTVNWWLHIYRRKTRAYAKLRPRSRAEYDRHLRIVAEMPLTKPQGARKVIGDLPVSAVTPAAADKLYERLVAGGVGKLGTNRVRQAGFEIDILKIAWRAVQRMHPDHFPKGNPFEGLTREARGTQTKVPATAAEAYALASALRDAGHPGLGAAALICFEWLQRPENVLGGAVTWSDYRPGESIRIQHWKTGKEILLALADDSGPLFPEIEEYLVTVPRLGTPIVLRKLSARGPDAKKQPAEGVLYQHRHAHAVIAKVREKAQLPAHLTLAACRHGGLTELGNAGATEAEGMALSSHSTPAAFRLYVKRTDEQRRSATRKRRNWRERGSG